MGMCSREKEIGYFVQLVIEELELLRDITPNQIGGEAQVTDSPIPSLSVRAPQWWEVAQEKPEMGSHLSSSYRGK